MVATPADISSASELPVDTGLISAHDAAPLTSYHEPLHFASAPTIDTPVFEDEIIPAPGTPAAPAAPAYPPAQKQFMEEPMEDHVRAPEGIISQQASNEIANTIGSLVRNISHEKSVAVSRGGITIEDIVREEIKPVLKAWLDTHLPSLVERIVRAEIERVVDRTQL
jgi:cell pole-organizing protein PopZ